LCADGTAYLCAEAGITAAVIENQAAYVAGWLKKLRDDRKLLIQQPRRRSTPRTIILQARHAV
jgi:antirestriction protein ArdC